MNSDEIRRKYLEFFNSRGHVTIPSASLLPEGDATTLFTGSGMQPLLKYLLGEKHPSGTRLVDSQKSFRAEDIDEVGDNRHTTFFEMLGNWSLGDYFKAEQLPWIFEFLVDVLGIDPKNLYVTVFAGAEQYNIPKDDDGVLLWQNLFKQQGIEAKAIFIGEPDSGAEIGQQDGRIFYYSAKKNWWSRSGPPEKMPAREPGGPDSELFYEFTNIEHNPIFGAKCHPNCDCGRFMEIGNSVFMEYRKTDSGGFEKLPQRNVDFGGGLERISSAVSGNADMFAIDLLRSLIDALPATPNQGGPESDNIRSKRIVADHIRSSSFLISDGVLPSNKERGYVLRKLLRRAIVHTDNLARQQASSNDNLHDNIEEILENLFRITVKNYAGTYDLNADAIIAVFKDECKKFRLTFKNSMHELRQYDVIDADIAFKLYESFGLPYEVVKEFAGDKAKGLTREDFEKKLEEHREISRAGAFKKFGGHGLLLDTGEIKAKDEVELKKVTRLHTATHLLQAGLREVLGTSVKQAGSDITVERTRFDFTFERKLTPEEIKKVEDVVNREIHNDLHVTCQEMPKAEAIKTGALFFFKAKYGDPVKVYFMGHDMESAFSKEFCGGPHVEHTAMVGKFRIAKEEAVSAGVRRIRGVIEP
jgi:alanyl-tRNA synthetase